jgi:hypothetical protein
MVIREKSIDWGLEKVVERDRSRGWQRQNYLQSL